MKLPAEGAWEDAFAFAFARSYFIIPERIHTCVHYRSVFVRVNVG